MDTSRVGVVAAQLMDTIAEDADAETNERVGEVMILAEIRGEDEDGPYTYISFRCSDEREWAQRGILHAALDLRREPREQGDD